MKLRPESLRFKENGLAVSPQNHSAATSPLPKLRDYVNCPTCNARVLLKNLEKHCNKMHKGIVLPPPPTLHIRLRPPRRVRPPFRRAPPPPPGSLVRCHACDGYIMENDLKKHRQRVHGKKAAARTGRKDTPNCPEDSNNGISKKAQARLHDPSVVYVPSSPPKAYATCEMCGDKMKTQNLLKHQDAHYPKDTIEYSPGLITTIKKHVKLTECKRCAHHKFRNELDRKNHYATSDFHPYCLACRSGFRGLEEYCAHLQRCAGRLGMSREDSRRFYSCIDRDSVDDSDSEGDILKSLFTSYRFPSS